MVTVATAALGAVAIVLAGMVHELTHAAAALPWARSRTIYWRDMQIEQEVPESLDHKWELWIQFAPLLVGLAALATLYLGVGLPPLSKETVLFYAAWGLYTSPSLVDVVEAAGGETSRRAEKPEVLKKKTQAAWEGITIESVGVLLVIGETTIFALLGIEQGPPPAVPQGGVTIGDAYLGLAIGLALGGAAYAIIGIELAERRYG